MMNVLNRLKSCFANSTSSSSRGDSISFVSQNCRKNKPLQSNGNASRTILFGLLQLLLFTSIFVGLPAHAVVDDYQFKGSSLKSGIAVSSTTIKLTAVAHPEPRTKIDGTFGQTTEYVDDFIYANSSLLVDYVSETCDSRLFTNHPSRAPPRV